MSLMASPGDFIRNEVRNPPCVGMVVHTSIYGVLCIEVRKTKIVHGLEVLDMAAVCASAEFKHWVIHDADDWMMLQVQTRSPLWAQENNMTNLLGAGVLVTIPMGDPISLPKAVAHDAFKHMTRPQLSNLITMYYIPYDRRRPTREAEVCALVVRFFLPDFDDEEVAEIVATRGNKCVSEASGGTLLCDELVKLTRQKGLGHTDFVQSLDEAPRSPLVDIFSAPFTEPPGCCSASIYKYT